jgi:hypothetical protein
MHAMVQWWRALEARCAAAVTLLLAANTSSASAHQVLLQILPQRLYV